MPLIQPEDQKIWDELQRSIVAVGIRIAAMPASKLTVGDIIWLGQISTIQMTSSIKRLTELLIAMRKMEGALGCADAEEEG